jgi:hypothetical protein
MLRLMPTPREVFAFPGRILAFKGRVIARILRGSVRATGAVVGIPVAALPVLTAVLAKLDPGEPGAHPFLSPEWIEAARAIREELRGKVTTTPPPFRMNQVVTGVPFGDGTINAHTDTTSGELSMELGHIEGAEVTVTLPYDTARAILVDGDQQAAMQAFMQGQIKVEGDMTKLMALQTAQIDPVALEAAARIRGITS